MNEVRGAAEFKKTRNRWRLIIEEGTFSLVRGGQSIADVESEFFKFLEKENGVSPLSTKRIAKQGRGDQSPGDSMKGGDWIVQVKEKPSNKSFHMWSQPFGTRMREGDHSKKE